MPQPFDWIAGLRIADDGPADFGDRRAEAAAALAGTVVAPLAELGVIEVRGADAESFLQGQLGNDLREATPQRAQLSSYSSPKGRALAVLTVIRRADGFWLLLPQDLLAATLKRLRLFVLRSKLTLDDASARTLALGLAGPEAPTLLAAAGLAAPAAAWDCTAEESLLVVRRPGREPRYLALGVAAALAPLWSALTGAARAVGPRAFRLLELLDGIPEVRADTSDRHVPQMLNLDQLGGISFTKGCYPGQEIVARLHYLGTLKRRLHVGRSAALPARGAPIHAQGDPAQPVGEVLDACASADGAAVQAVLTIAAATAGGLRIGAADGPPLLLDA